MAVVLLSLGRVKVGCGSCGDAVSGNEPSVVDRSTTLGEAGLASSETETS